MLFRLLAQQARRHGDRTAVAGEKRTLSFKELFSEATAAAAWLESRGCKAGDAVILGLPPCPEFYVTFYAAAALGMVVLPVLPSGKIPRAIVDHEPSWAIGDSRFAARSRLECGSLREAFDWGHRRGMAERSAAGWKRKKSFRTEHAIGVSSSGSTGEPTVYLRSHELLVRRAKFRVEAFGIVADDVLLSARPFNSGSSINSHVLMPLVAGCKIVVQEQIKRFEAADAITRERVTVLYAVPFVFELLASIPQNYPVDFSSLRLCISGSAPLGHALAESFARRFGVEIRQRYGGSHIHPAFTFNLAGVPGAVGQTFGSFPIVILDESGRAQGPGTIGEIAFDYQAIAPMWKKYLRTNPNRRGRYIFTGDLGRTDTDGNVYIVGRKSPFIKVFGNRVEPAEVEAVLRKHDGVREAFVFGLNRGRPDEMVAALVVAPGVEEAELVRYCAQRLDGYKCPRRIVFRDALPRTAHGKIARSELEQELTAAQSAHRSLSH